MVFSQPLGGTAAAITGALPLALRSAAFAAGPSASAAFTPSKEMAGWLYMPRQSPRPAEMIVWGAPACESGTPGYRLRPCFVESRDHCFACWRSSLRSECRPRSSTRSALRPRSTCPACTHPDAMSTRLGMRGRITRSPGPLRITHPALFTIIRAGITAVGRTAASATPQRHRRSRLRSAFRYQLPLLLSCRSSLMSSLPLP
jgi:hypothetical protein